MGIVTSTYHNSGNGGYVLRAFRRHFLKLATVSGASVFQTMALAVLGLLTGKILPVDDFGVTRTIMAYFYFLTVIGELCLHDGVAAFIAGSDDAEYRKRYIVNGSYLVMGASILFVLVFELLLYSDLVWTGELRSHMMAVFVFLPAASLGTVYMNVLPALGQHGKLSFNYLLNGFIQLAIIGVGAYVWQMEGWTSTRCLTYLLFLLFSGLQIRQYLELQRPDLRTMKTLWGFSKIHLIGGIFSLWFINADIIVMERLSMNMYDIANYAIGSMFAKSVMILPATIGRVYFKDISRSLISLERFSILTWKLLALTVVSCAFIAAALYVAAPFLIGVLFGDHYRSSVLIMRILCVGIAFRGVWNILTPIMVAARHPGFLLAMSLVANIVSMILFYFWIPTFGSVGTAWATNVAYIASSLFGCITLFTCRKMLVKGSVAAVSA